jgi:hypothetical protein
MIKFDPDTPRPVNRGACARPVSPGGGQHAESADGLLQLKKPVRNSRVVIENLVPGGLEKVGLAPEVLPAENPTQVIARISG